MSVSLDDIRRATYGLQDVLEGILLHYDDFASLRRSISEFNLGYSRERSEEKNYFKLFGVKIITTEFVKRGDIFKVFKNKDSHATHLIPPYKQTSVSIGESGNIWPDNKPWPSNNPIWSNDILDNFEAEVDTTESEQEQEQEPEKPKRNHSDKRKIQLD